VTGDVSTHVITPTDAVREFYEAKVNALITAGREDLVAALVAEYEDALRRSARQPVVAA
jgi:hypothetical protein